MNALSRLIGSHPKWCEVLYLSDEWVLLKARVELWEKPFLLSLYFNAVTGGVDVGESHLSKRVLPDFCLERHIMPNGRFCIAQDTDRIAMRIGLESRWWHDLYEYLESQYLANTSGYWPFERGMSHSGEGQAHQLSIEQLLETDLELRDEYVEGAFGNIGWLSEQNPTISFTAPRPLLKNTACPRGCFRLHGVYRKDQCHSNDCAPDCKRQHNPILNANCPKRTKIQQIIELETLRRRAERDLYAGWQKSAKCCGSMKMCPLGKGG